MDCTLISQKYDVKILKKNQVEQQATGKWFH